jgi:catechol 2,3-dioxygenase-like lactoylglutathione lyase family enzyme
VPSLLGVAPVLLVPDVEAALDHYRDRLGFEVWPYRDQRRAVYGYAERDGCNLHFALCKSGPSANGRLSPGMFDVYLWVDDVESLHAELGGRGADILEPPTDREYGLRDIRIRDLDGYVLGIGQPLESTA